MNLDLEIQPHFQHLLDVRGRLAVSAPERDALGVVTKMRNVVTHPTRDRPDTFDIYEWAEAGMHVRYRLCLALLNTAGYAGSVARALESEARWVGQVRAVPWATTT